jgi:hypothetical protein
MKLSGVPAMRPWPSGSCTIASTWSCCTKYHNTYRQSLRTLVDTKTRGEELKADAARPVFHPVPDILEERPPLPTVRVLVCWWCKVQFQTSMGSTRKRA